MTKEQVSPVLDLNEHAMNPAFHTLLQQHDDVLDVSVADLDAADLVIGDVGFERKSWSDYASSMMDDRFTEQKEKLVEYDHAYVLVDGGLDESDDLTHTEMSGASIRGHMASLTAREDDKVRAVVPCSNLALLVDVAVRLARKHSEDPTRSYIPTGVHAPDVPVGKRMWGCFDGVGPELADRLYEEHGGPLDLVQLAEAPSINLREELTKIEGIGEDLSYDIVRQI